MSLWVNKVVVSPNFWVKLGYRLNQINPSQIREEDFQYKKVHRREKEKTKRYPYSPTNTPLEYRNPFGSTTLGTHANKTGDQRPLYRKGKLTTYRTSKSVNKTGVSTWNTRRRIHPGTYCRNEVETDPWKPKLHVASSLKDSKTECLWFHLKPLRPLGLCDYPLLFYGVLSGRENSVSWFFTRTRWIVSSSYSFLQVTFVVEFTSSSPTQFKSITNK